MSSSLRIVFLGSDSIALPLLNWLTTDPAARERFEVVAVFTQPDRATGRGQLVTPNAIKAWALERSLPVLQPEKLTPEVREQLAGLNPDVGLVMAYGHILKDDFINTPRLGTLNLHTSLLPKYRGASPIQTAIAEGERETGVTLMRIVRRLDAGPVADVERVAIGPLETAADIETKLSQACVPLLARALPSFVAGSLQFLPQDEANAIYCGKLEKSDGVLDFTEPARVLAARVNGLFPWPSCQVSINGQQIKLGLADVADANASPPAESPGKILGQDAEGLLVATADGVLRLRRLQRPGGKMLGAADFLRGFTIPAGTMIPSQPMPALVETRAT
jgi:methionyl-tRNA formyltransferase